MPHRLLEDLLRPHALEQATLATWRARVDEERLGWRFLAEDGVTGRVNAVWPIAWTGPVVVGPAIEAAEAWYAARGLPCVFKIADGCVFPDGLTDELAARGYAPHTETLVMTGPAAVTAPVVDAAVTLQQEAAGAFDDVLIATAASFPDLAERRAIVSRAPSPKAFAIARRGDEALAVGMTAATKDGLAGVFAMRTAPHARRQGLAQAVLAALGAFAHANGAHTLFLQVEAANTPAVRLYEKAGLETAYAYRYWRRP